MASGVLFSVMREDEAVILFVPIMDDVQKVDCYKNKKTKLLIKTRSRTRAVQYVGTDEFCSNRIF